jgi:hypothetical protein
MSYKTHTDNIYKEGTFIRAKANPNVELVILKYFQRTYYCGVVGDASHQQLTYFERELLPPAKVNNKK